MYVFPNLFRQSIQIHTSSKLSYTVKSLKKRPFSGLGKSSIFLEFRHPETYLSSKRKMELDKSSDLQRIPVFRESSFQRIS